MIYEMQKLVSMLRPFGHAAAMRIAQAAFDSLTLEERAGIGLALVKEEERYAAVVAKALRTELGRALPGGSGGCKRLKRATP